MDTKTHVNKGNYMAHRTVGQREANEFHDAIAEVGAEIPYQNAAYEILLAGAGGVHLHGAPDGYDAALSAGASIVADDFRIALERFRRAAVDFLGERPYRDEAMTDYFRRIAGIAGLGVESMVATMRRNGIRLAA